MSKKCCEYQDSSLKRDYICTTGTCPTRQGYTLIGSWDSDCTCNKDCVPATKAMEIEDSILGLEINESRVLLAEVQGRLSVLARFGRLHEFQKQSEPEFPNQSEPGKCELRATKEGSLYCVQKDGCKGECILYSLPNNNPSGKEKAEGTFTKDHPLKPDPKRYYYCRCLEL